MYHGARWAGTAGLGLAGVGLTLLHALPTPQLHATTGAHPPYRPWNFLSEYVRTDHAPLMTACFFLLALGTLASATILFRKHLRWEAALLALAGMALLLLGLFPTDLADMTTDAVTCGQAARIEPCTLAGRVHNPLSTLVLVPILLVVGSFCVRSRREPQWRGVTRLAVACGALALCGLTAAFFYLHALGWQGRWWTGLQQRSLVFPILAWMTGLLVAITKDGSPREG
ncbi:MAG: DUF998 domain-containing protein [Cytophagales bacterium]|nr:DUF998 domain-containing protein [Armatimonadota bacterium]